MSDFNDIRTEDLIKTMCDLVSESRRLAERHDEVVAEYEQLRKELERRGDVLSKAAIAGRGGTC